MPTYRHRLAILAAAAVAVLAAASASADTVPLRGDFPPGAGDVAVPLVGGVPLSRGALASAENVRLLGADGKEVPCQVAATAWWPDKSIKWVLVDAVLSPRQAQSLALEYGPAVRRAAVPDPLRAAAEGDGVGILGGGVTAAMSRGGGVLDACTLAGRTLVEDGKPARLVLNTLRIADGAGGKALPTHTYVCRDPEALIDVGKAEVQELAVESSGPIRATVRLRGHVRLEHFGATLPEDVTKREPAGRVPFSLRLSFYRGCPVVYGQHQIIFSGEPDCDFIARWAIELPGQAGPRGRLVLEPGVELDTADGLATLARGPTRRLCWARTKTGFALIRQGWENRPAGIMHAAGSAFVDFWPEAAGVWDLRRYAREWAVGESGDTKDAEAMLRYAKFAARGMAKSHDFVLWAGGASAGTAEALAGRALLLAPPAWYARSQALGPLAPEQSDGPYAAIDATTRRRLDYMLFCQDLYRWHGKLAYGFWQTRFGEVHRTDRWENDYGRWAWSLNDGAGRVGHVLMNQFLRTLDRRYLDAGQAFCRATYDTAMVHTEQHLEGARNWWTAKGCTHRHNVQPFGCPYIGMRGSQPSGQRVLYFLTGDGVIADGLELVADACFRYAEGARGRLCNSGGSDGQGSAACALLWKYETTADPKYLDACRKVLDASGLVPPKDAKALGYGPDFGLFNAAGEYADLSGDEAFRRRVVEVARMGLAAKEPGPFLYPIAMAARWTGDKALRDGLARALESWQASRGETLAELPPGQWPGHAGWRVARANWNVVRDVPCALAVVAPAPKALSWPRLRPNAASMPAHAPADWFRPGGALRMEEVERINRSWSDSGQTVREASLKAGAAEWRVRQAIADDVRVSGAAPLAGPIVPYVDLVTPRGDDLRLVAKIETLEGRVTRVRTEKSGLVLASGDIGPGTFEAYLLACPADGVAAIHLGVNLALPPDAGRIASWGLRVPLKLSADAHAIQATAPGRFRLERCRLDQNDERIPNWLTSEYNHGEGAPLWPTWRLFGVRYGPDEKTCIWKANRPDTSPLLCDEGTVAWLDVTDRGAKPAWGLTVRMTPLDTGPHHGVRANLETGLVEVQFHDAAAPPPNPDGLAEGSRGKVAEQLRGRHVGVADLIFHDGWRPPLAKPELSREQYERFLNDLDYGGNYGLMALRFCLSTTHQVQGRQWAERVRDLGLEPREILYAMLWRDGLARHCEKLGVAWDAADPEGSVRRVIDHYRR